MYIGQHRQLAALTKEAKALVKGIECLDSILLIRTGVKYHVAKCEVGQEVRVIVDTLDGVLECQAGCKPINSQLQHNAT